MITCWRWTIIATEILFIFRSERLAAADITDEVCMFFKEPSHQHHAVGVESERCYSSNSWSWHSSIFAFWRRQTLQKISIISKDDNIIIIIIIIINVKINVALSENASRTRYTIKIKLKLRK